MAGVNAGRLNIEIVAEIARLQQDLDKAKRAVKSMSNDIARDTRAANDNLGRMGRGFEQGAASSKQFSFGMRQLGFQINDVATQMALGTKASTIFAQQSGQVIQAIQLMNGGTSRLGAFLAGPWGIAISTAVIALTPFVSKLLDGEDAAKKVEFASYKLGDAQSVLGSIMDLTTGKINTQSNALIALARAQALAGQIEARRQMASARGGLAGEARFRTIIGGNFGGGLTVTRGRDASGDIASAFLDGTLNYDEAVRGLESLRKTGYLTEQKFLDLAKSITDAGVAGENLKVFQDLEKAIGGDKDAISQFLKPSRERAARSGRKPGLSDEAKALQDRNRETVRFIESLEEEIAKIGLTEGQLRQLEIARASETAVTQEQRRRIDELNAAREEAITIQKREDALERERKANQDFEDKTLAPLREEIALHGLVGQARERAALLLQKEAMLAEWAAKGMTDLNAKWEDYLSLNEKLWAQQAELEAFEERFGRVRDFLADVNKTPEQMAAAWDDVKMNGLDAFNDGIVDAIVNFRSLGDVAQSIIRQILADMLRLQIQQAIIGPLASALGLSAGGGMPTNLLAGTPFGGGAASGRDHVSPGTAYTIGERGPETFVPSVPGRIVPNGVNDNGGGVWNVNVTVDGAMNDRQARQTGDQIGRRIKRQINGR